MPPKKGNPAHLFRLQLLIIDGGLLVLRNILDQSLKSQGDTLVACLSRENATITHLRSKGIITQFQNNILFPLGGRVPNTTDLDITLIVCLIRGLKCFGFNPKFNWKVGPPKGDVSLEADIWWLKDYRNKMCHIRETTEVQAKDFTTWWNDIEQILIRMNPSSATVNIKQSIEDFKTCPLDAEEEKRIKKEIVKWEDYEEKVDRLQEDVNVIKEDLDDLKKRRRDDDGKMEHMLDFFKNQQMLVQDLLVNLGEDRNITRKIKVYDTVLDVKCGAMDEPTIDWLENLIMIACKFKKSTNSPEEDKKLQTKLIEFVSRSEFVTGAKVIEGDKKCVVIKFRCESNGQVLKLLQYLDSDDLKYQLEEIANVVKQRLKTDEQIYFSWRFSSDCLEKILEEIVEKDTDLEIALKKEKTKYQQPLEEEEKFQHLKKGLHRSEEEYEQVKKGQQGLSLAEKVHRPFTFVGQRVFWLVRKVTRLFKKDVENVQQLKKDIFLDEENSTQDYPELIDLRTGHGPWLHEEEFQQLKKDEENSTQDYPELIDLRTGHGPWLHEEEFQQLKKDEEKSRKDSPKFKDSRTGQGPLLGEEKFQQLKKDEEKSRKDSPTFKDSRTGQGPLLGEEKFQQLKKEFKDDLITFYNTNHSKVPLSPLFEENDVPMELFYIRPGINRIYGKYSNDISLSDMFTYYTFGEEIYLTADDGIGKTTFSKYLAFTWCQAHTLHDREKKYFEEADIECMHDFEFVFLVLLRDSNDLCSIDDLIHELIIPHLAHSERYTKRFLYQILKGGRCLVILDGLDECVPFGEISSLLHPGYRSTKVLKTMRSWKLCFLEKRHQIKLKDHFTLTKPTDDSRDRLAKRSIQRLKHISNEENLNTEINDLNRVIRAKGIDELANVTLLLTYIISLWCDGAPIGSSKTEIYINIVELLLARTTAKYKELQSSPDPFQQDIPKCFAGHDHCRKYFALLMALGTLAYHALVEKKTLVFDELVARKYLKEDDMKLSLYSGILMEGKHKTSKVSFAHKTVQEFFVAIYICSEIEYQKTVLEKCKSVENILDMSTVFQFSSGIDATLMCQISHGLMSVINKDEGTGKYRFSIGREWNITKNPLYIIHHMLVSCLREIPESENLQLLCIQDLFIDKNSEQELGCLSKLNKYSIKSLYVNTDGIVRRESEIIELFSVTGLQYLLKLHLYRWSEYCQIDRFLSPSLQSIALLSGTWTSYDKNLTERLEQIRSLQKLYVSNYKFSHGILDMFVKFISRNKTLKEINLSTVDCIEHGRDCEQVRLDLSQQYQLTTVDLKSLPSLHLNISMPSLEYVTLGCTNLEGSSILLSPEMKSIKRVDLDQVEMPADSLQHLKSLPQSVTVDMYRCTIKPEKERERLRNDILSSPRFEVERDDFKEGLWDFVFRTK